MDAGSISGHMECPGCSEEIHEQELIDGECPLCGTAVEGRGGDFDGAISDIVEFFQEQPDTMAINVERRSTSARELVLHETPSLLDRVKPKKCGTCGRWHVRFGDKRLDVRLDGTEGELDRSYHCRLCEPVDE